jgi:hypothetical protein
MGFETKGRDPAPWASPLTVIARSLVVQAIVETGKVRRYENFDDPNLAIVPKKENCCVA